MSSLQLNNPMPADTRNNKSLITLIIGVVCLVLAIWSALWFWASLLTVRPEIIVTKWEQGKIGFDEQLAKDLVVPLKQSLSLNSLDANTHLILARIYEQLANNDEEKQQAYNELAEQQYNTAILNNPTWDYAWARFATFYNEQELATLANREEKIARTLIQAISLGPYEEKTQTLTIPIIFEHWDLLSSSENNPQIEKTIKHALKHNENSLLTLESAKIHNKLDNLEPLISKKWQLNLLKK